MDRATVIEYLRACQSSVQMQDGPRLAQLLSLRDEAHVALTAQALSHNLTSKADIVRQVPAPFDGMVHAHMLASSQLSSPRQAYDHQHTLFQLVSDAVKTLAGNWTLPVLNQVVRDLRVLAANADRSSSSSSSSIINASSGATLTSTTAATTTASTTTSSAEQGEGGKLLDSLCSEIRSLFVTLNADRDSDYSRSKRVGAVMLVNHLMAIVFKLSNSSLMTIVARVAFDRPLLECISPAVRAQYEFQMGRYEMLLGDNQESAAGRFTLALQLCPPSAYKNRRLILIFLTAINLCKGRLQHLDMLAHYNLSAYYELTLAVRTGNIALFSAALQQHQAFFIQWGLLLFLRRARVLAYRSLFRKVYLILKNAGTKVFEIERFQSVLRALGEELSSEEVTCLLAVLIQRGFAVGVIGKKQQDGSTYVSFRSTNAFPPLPLPLAG